MRFYRLFCVVGSWLTLACQPSGNDRTTERGTAPFGSDRAAGIISGPERVQILFADSTNRALFWDTASMIEPMGKGFRVDWLSLVYVSKAALPFRINTALMHIDVLELPLLVQIDAFDDQAGQSLEVYSGALKVGKSYDSPFPDIDTLHTGDLYMINKGIDLSEKERLDDLSILHWWKETYSKNFPNTLASGF